MNLPIPAAYKRHASLRIPVHAPLAVLLAASLAA